MKSELSTVEGALALESIRPLLQTAFDLIDRREFARAEAELESAKDFARCRINDVVDEWFLNDLWVLERYVGVIEEYMDTWKLLLMGSFSNSWVRLQDALDSLRCLKKFSGIGVAFFESQLLELERIYPYKLFFSVGIAAEYFECSICGKDIDSIECEHRKGELYGGVMAVALARNIAKLDHVSIVGVPEDKRCVVQYDDNGPQFSIVRFLKHQVKTKNLRLSAFRALQMVKRPGLGPSFAGLGRNQDCACGSKQKFKRCCLGKKGILHDHAELVFAADQVIAIGA